MFTQEDEWQKLKNGIKNLALIEVLSRFNKIGYETKSDGSLLTAADTQMQFACHKFLTNNWPQFSFLGEESTTQQQIKALDSTSGCWILDPVDGTSNFASGIPIFTVSLALIVNKKIVAGLVYDPNQDEMFAARINLGAELNNQPLISKTTKEKLSQCTAIVDFKRLPYSLSNAIISKSPFASQRSIGSVALDWCWIAAGRGQLYWHGAQNLWDYAAGYLILTETGGHNYTFTKEDVMLAKIIKRSVIAATNKNLFKLWQDYIFKNL